MFYQFSKNIADVGDLGILVIVLTQYGGAVKDISFSGLVLVIVLVSVAASRILPNSGEIYASEMLRSRLKLSHVPLSLAGQPSGQCEEGGGEGGGRGRGTEGVGCLRK